MLSGREPKMPTLRGRKIPAMETNANPNSEMGSDQIQTPKMSLYEQSREERIKQNLERMQKLGLMDLSLKLKSFTSSKRTPRNNPSSPKPTSPQQSSGPLRRSSRLQNVTPVSYSEVVLAKKDELLNEDVVLEEGSKPEVYAEEHEKLLGNTERSWKLFIDGYGKDGRRIYDQINGKTCHQCRQKTLGYRTHCSKCQIVQGQFCGDCLYMRYGEHILEAIENPNWICPVCRGICNCSLCRHAKGWAPTGSLYRKISSLGYKSVAHYLIQTRCSQNNMGKDSDTQVSVKRSLPFLDMEAPSEESSHANNNQVAPVEPQSEVKIHVEFKGQIGMSSCENLTDGQTRKSLPFPVSEAESKNKESAEDDNEVHDHLGLSKPTFEAKRVIGLSMPLESSLVNDKRVDSLESKSEVKMHNTFKIKQEKATQSNVNLANDVLSKLSLSSSYSEAESKIMNSAAVDHEHHDHLGLSKSEFEEKRENEFKFEEEKELHSADKEHEDSNIALESCPKHVKKCALDIEPNLDSIAARLRQRCRKGHGHVDVGLVGVKEINSDAKDLLSSKDSKKEGEMNVEDGKHADRTVSSESSPKLKKKPARSAQSNPDSIGARLRQRRRMGKGRDDEVLPGANEQTSNVGQAF